MQPRYPIIDPGLLRHSVIIQSPSTVMDEAGQPTEDWANTLTVWASIENIKSIERFQGAQFTAEATHLITIRYVPDHIDATMRVQFRSQIYKIQNVDDVRQLNVAIELTCLALNEGSGSA